MSFSGTPFSFCTEPRRAAEQTEKKHAGQIAQTRVERLSLEERGRRRQRTRSDRVLSRAHRRPSRRPNVVGPKFTARTKSRRSSIARIVAMTKVELALARADEPRVVRDVHEEVRIHVASPRAPLRAACPRSSSGRPRGSGRSRARLGARPESSPCLARRCGEARGIDPRAERPRRTRADASCGTADRLLPPCAMVAELYEPSGVPMMSPVRTGPRTPGWRMA